MTLRQLYHDHLFNQGLFDDAVACVFESMTDSNVHEVQEVARRLDDKVSDYSTVGDEEFAKSPEGIKQAEETTAFLERAAAAKAAGILPFAKSDPAGWEKAVAANKDGYGAGVIRYAARWANLMEAQVGEGDITDIAQSASHEADLEGISGFQFGAAVGILSKTWVRGADLALWHLMRYGR